MREQVWQAWSRGLEPHPPSTKELKEVILLIGKGVQISTDAHAYLQSFLSIERKQANLK